MQDLFVVSAPSLLGEKCISKRDEDRLENILKANV